LFATTACSAEATDPKKKVLVISGPTGAGKSRLALEIAKRLNGEIVSADSVQVYRGLDIGSAKPSLLDRQEVPHHLIDILHPAEEYSVGQFYEDARKTTDGIISRGRIPIITGGTGLYLRWFIYGKPDVPKASSEVTIEAHSELRGLEKTGDWDAAVRMLVEAGDPGVQSLSENDWYRLRRRLEILKSSGAPPSAFQVPYNTLKEKVQLRDHVSGSIGKEFEGSLDYEFICFFLTTQRPDLYRSIDLRCETMILDGGILSEAKWLLDLGLFPSSSSATRAIGYRQAMEFLLMSREVEDWCSPRQVLGFLSRFQTASRNFAKRQLTWFRNDPIYHWIDASKPLETVVDFISEACDDHGRGMIFRVPPSLAVEKDERDVRQLKSYRTRNR
ncbi:hypothetical protein M569_08195, partial [Genlisea aurea]